MAGKKNNLVMLACGFVLVFTLIIGPVNADNMTWEDTTNRLGNDYDSLVPVHQDMTGLQSHAVITA